MKDFALSVLIVGILILFFARYDPAMKDAVFSVLGVVFAAYLVWLTVRIVNSRDERAIRTAVILALVFVAYPLDIGADILARRTRLFANGTATVLFLNLLLSPVFFTIGFGPPAIGRWMAWYMGLWNR